MNLENLIYKRLSEAKNLTKHLTTFGGKPAVFTPEAPGDRAVGWGTTTQYPRIVFNFDMQTDGERKSAGTLLVSLICRNDSDAVPELIEPAVRECLKDDLLKDDSDTLYAFAWARTDGFSMTEEKNELLIGSEIRFDIIEYPCQETTDPDPIVAMARYIILRRDIKECTLTNTVTDDDGNSVEQESTAFSCEEMQYRYRGEVTADDVAAKFDYWWDIASGKTQQEAEDDDAKRNDEPTLSERVEALEGAFMEFVEVVLNG